MSAHYKFVEASEEVIRRTKVVELWKMGLDGKGVRVAVVDSGINPSAIKGRAPIFEHDFTGENNVGDRQPPHGTVIANCIRLMAPQCDILNAKVVPHRGTTSKKKVAYALIELCKQDVDIVNISLDFDAERCNPRFRNKLSDGHGAIFVSKELDRSTICQLCLSCWDLALSGIAVIVAAGNRWGKTTHCPGRSPGSLCVEATTTKTEWDYFYSSRSFLRRWWDWKLSGREARKFGTSFSAGYTSGEIALLMPWIRQLGWNEAKRRISSIESKATTTALQMHDSLVFDSNECHQVNKVIKIAKQEGRISGHLNAVELLHNIEPKSVPSACRESIANYLGDLSEGIANMESEILELFDRVGMDNVLECWIKDPEH